MASGGMKNLAFVFPGQGSQSVGMGRALYDAYPCAREVFEEAGDVLGVDIKRISFEGPEDELNLTENTQPALLTASFAALSVLGKEVPVFPALVSGHSLGEYTALVSAGVIEFSDALRLVRLRGRFMQEGVEEGVGRMCAVIGLDPSTVDDICRNSSAVGEVVVCANINSPEQVVMSGHAKAIERASAEAKKRGAKRVISLPVSVPSHSPLMEGAARRLDRELAKVTFGEFKIPLVTNVEARLCRERERVRELLVRQLVSPVRWTDVVRRMRAAGISITIEIGPGSVLSGLIRRIDSSITTLNFSAPGDIEAVRNLSGV